MTQKSLVIGVIGTGTMGCGIAQVAAQCGYQVLFQNRKQDSVDKGLSKIDKSLQGLAAKGKLSAAQVEAIQEHIRGVVPLEELKQEVARTGGRQAGGRPPEQGAPGDGRNGP